MASDKNFAGQVEQMFEADFRRSRAVSMADFEEHGFVFRVWVRIAKLFAPIL